ncbi:porin [Bernardetia sp.]|uniref:porin n=1 Tax=Bernardetia sp. TaxID=1937974 RepID=UPI0025B7CAF0|nr:porin [Bernardetia sp.]
MRQQLLLLCFFLTSTSLFAQNDTTKLDIILSKIKFGAYLETYYIYDFNEPENHVRPNFFYAYHRHNELALNLGLIQAEYETYSARAKIALMAGTYSNINLAAEEGVLRNIYEAYIGTRLSKNKNLWVDAGIFSSHIGFESAVGKDCWNMTRSILAENSPYYESGIKISYTSYNEKWFLSGLLLNGWQRIQRVEGNQTLGFGHQITFSPTEKVTLNSSSFVGNDYPTDEKKMRYFHNFFTQIDFSEKFGIIAGFDIGTEQKETKSSEYNIWYSPILIARYKPTQKIALAARIEHYNDQNGVIVPKTTQNGFQVTGFSFNFDYAIAEKLLWRIEYRNLNSKDDYFVRDNELISTNQFLGSALAISF